MSFIRFRIAAAVSVALVFATAWSACTTRVAQTGQSVFVRLVLPTGFSAQASIEAHVIVDELSTADGGLFTQFAAPSRGKTEEGFESEQEVSATFDTDSCD